MDEKRKKFEDKIKKMIANKGQQQTLEIRLVINEIVIQVHGYKNYKHYEKWLKNAQKKQG